MIINRFTKDEVEAWTGFLKAYGYINGLIEKDLQTNWQLSHVEFEVLLRLFYTTSHQLRIQDLAKQSILTRSGMSRAVDRLEKSGFISKHVANEDHRGSYATLTKQGKKIFEAAMDQHVLFIRKYFLSHFSDSELKFMAKLWENIIG